MKAEGGLPVCFLHSMSNPLCYKHPHTALPLSAGDCPKVLVAVDIHNLACASLHLSQQTLNESSSRVPSLIPGRALIPYVSSCCNAQKLDAIPSFLKESQSRAKGRACPHSQPRGQQRDARRAEGSGALQELQAEPCLPPAADPSEQGADGFHSVGDLGA